MSLGFPEVYKSYIHIFLQISDKCTLHEQWLMYYTKFNKDDDPQ